MSELVISLPQEIQPNEMLEAISKVVAVSKENARLWLEALPERVEDAKEFLRNRIVQNEDGFCKILLDGDRAAWVNYDDNSSLIVEDGKVLVHNVPNADCLLAHVVFKYLLKVPE